MNTIDDQLGSRMSEDSWEEVLASDGRVYYYNRATGLSQWKRPDNEKLPDEEFWTILHDAQGNDFYYNKRTKKVQWERPEEFKKEIEKKHAVAQRRQNFFKMLSGSVPMDLNPLKQHSPGVFKIQEMSARFETDPRLINATEKERERFFDEWLILERKRRVDLEKSIIYAAMIRLKDALLQKSKTGEITFLTTWEELVQLMRDNQDWGILLNADRLRVFRTVKDSLYQEALESYSENRITTIKTDSQRRIQYIIALRELISRNLDSYVFASFDEVKGSIMALPEYQEMIKTTTGSSPIDLYYDVLDELLDSADRTAAIISLSPETLKYDDFYKENTDLLEPFSEAVRHFIFQICLRDYYRQKDTCLEAHKKKFDALLLLMKEKLVKCNNFRDAQKALCFEEEWRAFSLDGDRELVFDRYILWNKSRGANCEPGQILPGDDDYVDLGSITQVQILKSVSE